MKKVSVNRTDIKYYCDKY